MYIITGEEVFHIGETLEEAVENFEQVFGKVGNNCVCYEAKEIKVQRKFEIVEEK